MKEKYTTCISYITCVANFYIQSMVATTVANFRMQLVIHSAKWQSRHFVKRTVKETFKNVR